MAEIADDIDKLLLDVRKTISDNKLFLEKLVDESVEVEPEEYETFPPVEEEFEEL